MAADAASMVGDAALNGVFQGLAHALTPIIQKKLGQFWGVDKELKRLKRYLLGVQPLLNDAETRQFTEESVRSWVGDLRGLTYDMEDIVDEMNYELLRLQLENKDKSDGQQVQTLASSLKLDKVFSAVENCSFNYQIASKINEVLEKWEEIVEYGNALNLREGVGGRTLGDIRKRRETTSFVDKNRVFGRESDKEEIISFLKSDESSERGNLSVIGIVGMGGLGKTTLAKLAYNDTDQFDMKVWVHVSHDFDRVRVIRCIIEAITNAKYELESLDLMQCHLHELVKEKKLLLVLDDAWTENTEDWETLLVPLIRSVQKGSKIIATTQSEKVCKGMGSRDCIYKLKVLSDDACWTIVQEKVFGYSGNAEEQANLEKLRVKVVKKCQGLPLAANVVGGLLGTVQVDKWERLLESKIWELPKTKDYILPVLMLSYLCLDPHLKRCFTYTATCFNRNSFYKKEIIRLWMAEGFIEVNKSDEMEDIANDYFDSLVARHFFQTYHDEISEYGGYGMHDLIREFAEVIMGNISFRIQGEIGKERPTEETRHVSLGPKAKSLILDKLVIAKSLRTLSIVDASVDEVLKQINHGFKRLRVLDLNGYSILEIHESIGNLKHLRQLDLVGNHTKSLPDSICTLYNLQTLNLNDCKNLLKLPGGIRSLINLRYLLLRRTKLQMLPDSLCKLEKLQEVDLSSCHKFVVLPTNIGDLKNLRSLDIQGTSVKKLPDSICRLYNLQSLCLWNCNKLTELPKEMSNLINLKSFDIKEELIKTSLLPSIERFTNIRRLSNYCITNESGIGQLNLLINLHEIRITNLENVESVEEGREANLKNKHQLVKLVMEWSGPDSSNLRDGNYETEILEALEPSHVNLRHLTVKNYGGFKFPGWLGDPSFSKLVEIELIGCSKCKLLTSLGQLRSLKKLVIVEMQELKYVGCEFFGNGAFPSLLKLQLKHLPNLEGWFEAKEGDFPRPFTTLSELYMDNCPNMMSFGKGFQNITCLKSLSIIDCPRLESSPSELTLVSCLRYLNVVGCSNTTLSGVLPHLSTLEHLLIKEIDGLQYLPHDLLLNLTSLKYLEIKDCVVLTSLLAELPSSLIKLTIMRCTKLTSLPYQLPSSLEMLMIKHCTELTSLSNQLPSSLEILKIEHCTELASLPDELPSSLKRFSISYCYKIKSLPKGLCNLTSLKYLDIYYCPLVESFPDNGLPTGLLSLTIFGCPTLSQ